MNTRLYALLITLIMLNGLPAASRNYYISGTNGDDRFTGLTPLQGWKTTAPLADIQLKPGDSVLFAAGQNFTGQLSLRNISGSEYAPIVLSAYPVNGRTGKAILDAGKDLYALLIQNASFIHIHNLAFTGKTPVTLPEPGTKEAMRCGILVEVTSPEKYKDIRLTDITVHDVYFHAPGFTRTAAETASANGTQSYGWGIRFIVQHKEGRLENILVRETEIHHVSHTGLKITGPANSIQNMEVKDNLVYQTGGPGMQFSGVTDGHIHHNRIHHSGSPSDSRNWARGSGLWTWSCTNILIEHNRFENANGPGDSAGVHIDYNCSDVIVQYNLSANNAGGFCEILGNNFNCAYRYNISINDGFRTKGKNGAFQEGKIFWLSGYQGNNKEKAGPCNSYFYNNSIYVSADIIPKIAISSSASGVLIANNIFCFENPAVNVAGDQKKNEKDSSLASNVVFMNNLFLRPDNWPAARILKDSAPLFGNPDYTHKGGLNFTDYIPRNKPLIKNKGIRIQLLPGDAKGLLKGLTLPADILGNPVSGLPDLGAIELTDRN